ELQSMLRLVPPYEVHLVIADGPFFVETIKVESFDDLACESLNRLMNAGLVIQHGCYYEEPQVLMQSVITRHYIRVVKEPVPMLHEQVNVPTIFGTNQWGTDAYLDGSITIGHVHPSVLIKRTLRWGVLFSP